MELRAIKLHYTVRQSRIKSYHNFSINLRQKYLKKHKVSYKAVDAWINIKRFQIIIGKTGLMDAAKSISH